MYMYAKHKGVICIKTQREMGGIGKYYIKLHEMKNGVNIRDVHPMGNMAIQLTLRR